MPISTRMSPRRLGFILKVWLLQTGEPLHIDSGLSRPMRAVSLSNKLVDAGHDVVLWSSAFSHQHKRHRSKEYTIHQINNNLEIRLIPSCGYKKHIGLGRLIDHAQLAWNLKRLLEKEKDKPSVAFIGYPPIEVAAVISRWLKKRNVPMTLDIKDLWPLMFIEALPDFLQPLGKVVFYPYFYLAKRTIQEVNCVSSPTQGLLEWALSFADKKGSELDKVFRLTPPDAQSTTKELLLAKTWWQEQGVDGSLPVVSFVGSFTSGVCFKPVQQAIKQLLAQGIKCQFVLCGSGDCLDKVKTMMQALPNVVFPGWIDSHEIESLAKMSIASLAPYRNIDNFILNIPNKIVDALMLGLPILSPLKGVVADLILNHNVGLTYGKDKTLKQCIEIILTNKALQRTISNNARKLYSDDFEFNKVYDDFVVHLERMAKDER